jgi:hypothetical protein
MGAMKRPRSSPENLPTSVAEGVKQTSLSRNFNASNRKAANSIAKSSVSQHSNSDARRILVNHVEEERKNMGVGHPDFSPFDRAVERREEHLHSSEAGKVLFESNS